MQGPWFGLAIGVLASSGGYAFYRASRHERVLTAEREALLRQCETLEFYQAALNGMAEAVIVTNASGVVQLSNELAGQLTGIPAHQALGQAIDAVFCVAEENSRAASESPVWRALREGTPFGPVTASLLARSADAGIPVECTVAPIRNHRDRILDGAVLVFRNVSERKRAAARTQLLAAIVDSSQDAVVGKTLDGIITAWNQGAESIFGYSAAEIIGAPVSRLIPPDRADEMRLILDRIRAGERVEHYETERLTRDGRRINVSLTISPVRDETGRIIGASKIARDITSQRAMEERLRQSHKIEAIGHLAGGIAHDFNNLLTVINGYSKLLLQQQAPGPEGAERWT